MEEVAAEVAMRGCCACTARAGSGCAVEIGAVEEVAVEVAAEVAMRGGCACTARAGSGCANTGVCAITDAGGISVAVVLDSCSVGDVCGCCCVVLGPAEVPGASGGCCSSTVAVEVISVEFAVEIGAVELAVEVVAVEIGAVEIGAVEVAVGESSRG